MTAKLSIPLAQLFRHTPEAPAWQDLLRTHGPEDALQQASLPCIKPAADAVQRALWEDWGLVVELLPEGVFRFYAPPASWSAARRQALLREAAQRFRQLLLHYLQHGPPEEDTETPDTIPPGVA